MDIRTLHHKEESMTLNLRHQLLALISGLLLALSGCSKHDDPSKLSPSSLPAGNQKQSTAPHSQQSSDKQSEDLARIREIMEKQEAEKQAAIEADRKWKENVKKGAAAPLKEYKF